MEQSLLEQEKAAEKPAGKGRAHRPKRPALILVIVLVLVGTGLFVLMNNREETEYPDTLVTGEVSVTEEGFSPDTIKISVGESVTWKNTGSGVHQIASDPHPTHETLPGLYSPEPLRNGSSYTYTFEEPGTYTYHDESNPISSRGTVIVE